MDEVLKRALRKFLRKRFSTSKLRLRDCRRIFRYCRRTVRDNLDLFRQNHSVATAKGRKQWFIAIYNSALSRLVQRSKRTLNVLEAITSSPITGSLAGNKQAQQPTFDEIVSVYKDIPCDEQMREVAVARLENATEDQIRTRFSLTEFELIEHDQFFQEMVAHEIAYHQQLVIALSDFRRPARRIPVVENYIQMPPASRLEQLQTWQTQLATTKLSTADFQIAMEIISELLTKVNVIPEPNDIKDIHVLIEILRPIPHSGN